MGMEATTTPEAKEATAMTTTATDSFLADRAAWVAKGRPADPADPHWAGVLAAEADRLAGVRHLVTPLVVFG